MITQAILNLDPELRFSINGEVNNETDYNNIQWIIGVDADGSAIVGTPDSIPLWADVQTEIARLEAEALASQYLKNREKAMKEQLPEMMYMPAILEQFKMDRDSGPKSLQPALEEAVNIYDQIMIDHPDPSG